MKPYGEFDVYIIQSTVYVEPKSLDCDLEGAWEACHFIFWCGFPLPLPPL